MRLQSVWDHIRDVVWGHDAAVDTSCPLPRCLTRQTPPSSPLKSPHPHCGPDAECLLQSSLDRRQVLQLAASFGLTLVAGLFAPVSSLGWAGKQALTSLPSQIPTVPSCPARPSRWCLAEDIVLNGELWRRHTWHYMDGQGTTYVVQWPKQAGVLNRTYRTSVPQ